MYDCISWINRNYKKTGRSTFENQAKKLYVLGGILIS